MVVKLRERTPITTGGWSSQDLSGKFSLLGGGLRTRCEVRRSCHFRASRVTFEDIVANYAVANLELWWVSNFRRWTLTFSMNFITNFCVAYEIKFFLMMCVQRLLVHKFVLSSCVLVFLKGVVVIYYIIRAFHFKLSACAVFIFIVTSYRIPFIDKLAV